MSQPTRRYHVPSALRRSSLRIEPDEAWERVGAGAALVDVRRHEDAAVSVPGALRIPPDELPDRLDELPAGGPVVLACT
jgi:rhodanese-related sulfurtransferase